MSVNMILKLTAKPGEVNDLIKWCTESFSTTRSFEGCEELNLFKVAGEMDTLMIVEQWTSQEHYEAYFNWRVENGTIKELFSRLSIPIGITRIELLPA